MINWYFEDVNSNKRYRRYPLIAEDNGHEVSLY